MTIPPETSLGRHFGELPDPRSGQNVRHPLLSIISIAICAVICGADDWVEVEQFGQAKHEWLSSFLALPHGIPSHDTFGRVFRYLNPDQFQACFQAWTQALCQLTAGAVVAIDGKQVRRSKDGVLGRDGIYLVNVWASDNQVVLAQEQVPDHTTETKAIPKLLSLLDLEGSVVTVDSLSCQPDVAEAIVAQKADYVMAVKENQPTLWHDVQAAFEPTTGQYQPLFAQQVNKDHGRLEIRRCWANGDPAVVAFIDAYKHWPGLQTVVKIQSERRLPSKTEQQSRYFITSLPPDAKRILAAVRAHWQIENGLHWVLDIAFREDDSRVRKDHGPRNFAVLRQIALNLLKQERSLKVGVKAKRHRAGWDQPYLLKVLCSF
jgi:predicted transposase YbfD/YdcC